MVSENVIARLFTHSPMFLRRIDNVPGVALIDKALMTVDFFSNLIRTALSSIVTQINRGNTDARA